MLIALVATLATAGAVAFATQVSTAGGLAGPLALVGVLAALGVLAAFRLSREGELGELVRPRRGDLALGALVATLSYLASLGLANVLAPRGTARELWLSRVYLQVGDPAALARHYVAATALVMTLGALEELVFRGLVRASLEASLGSRRAYPLTALASALAWAPTIVTLRAPGGAPNPLVFLAALGTSLVFGAMVGRLGRLSVAMYAHGFFAWVILVQFPLWRLG